MAAGGASAGGSEYGPYLAQWRRRIHENVRYPLVARRRSLTGTVQLDIVIQPDGTIASVRIAASSAHDVLDEAALEAVRGLPPLPFPSHLVRRPLRARLPIVFDLQ
jgi:protein TonB